MIRVRTEIKGYKKIEQEIKSSKIYFSGYKDIYQNEFIRKTKWLVSMSVAVKCFLNQTLF